MVIGENQRFPAALIVPAYEELEKYCQHKGIPYGSKEEAIQQEEVLAKYDQIISQANSNFGQWEKIKKFRLLANDWTINAGELTPKLSLKRKVIYQKNEHIIQGIYTE